MPADATIGSIPASALERFAAAFGGELLGPGDEGYDDARSIWNGAIDRKPGLIARCSGPADVQAAVRLAREHDLRTSVRSGGHGVAGLALCDEGLVIDLSRLRGIRADPGARTVRVQAGALLGELDRETQAFGLAVPAGIVTHTGVAGLTLGGGIGWLTRRFGLSIDSLLAADIVTADGGFVTASETSHPDLYWGLRGGGGNFGIVTSFLFRAHELGPTVLAGPMLFPLERAAEVMDRYRPWAADAPDELGTIVNFRRAPAAPWVPPELHGVPVVMVTACWAGSVESGEEVIAPIKVLGPIHDLCEPKSFVAHQSTFDGAVVPGWHYYWKALEVPELSREAVDTIVEHTDGITSPRSYTIVFHLGGAMSRVGEMDTAYRGRAAGFAVNVNGVWLPEEARTADEHVAWTRGLFDALEPMSRGVYVNFLGEEGRDRVVEAYGTEQYRRLAELKARYDPTNLFRSNQNIEPAA